MRSRILAFCKYEFDCINVAMARSLLGNSFGKFGDAVRILLNRKTVINSLRSGVGCRMVPLCVLCYFAQEPGRILPVQSGGIFDGFGMIFISLLVVRHERTQGRL